MTDAPASTRPTTADARLSSLFPDPDGVVPFWRTRRARWGLVGLTTVALVASGFVAVNASGSEALNYRTAVAGTHDVQAVLNGVATVDLGAGQHSVGRGKVQIRDVRLEDHVSQNGRPEQHIVGR